MTEELKEIPPFKIGEWGWYASDNGEYYREGPEHSREAIIEVAKDAGLGEQEYEPGKWRLSFTIAHCQKKYIDLASYFSISGFLERIDDQLCDELSSEFDESSPLESIKTEPAKELEVLVMNTIREWQKRHGYDLPANTFEKIEGEESITIDRYEDVQIGDDERKLIDKVWK